MKTKLLPTYAVKNGSAILCSLKNQHRKEVYPTDISVNERGKRISSIKAQTKKGIIGQVVAKYFLKREKEALEGTASLGLGSRVESSIGTGYSTASNSYKKGSVRDLGD